MPINSKQKGARGEREAVKYLKSLGIDARRTAQYNGKEGTGDVVMALKPLVNVEVKYGYPIGSFDLGLSLFREAVEQARRDAGPGQTWVLLWKPKGYKQWRLTFLLSGYVVTVASDSEITTALYGA